MATNARWRVGAAAGAGGAFIHAFTCALRLRLDDGAMTALACGVRTWSSTGPPTIGARDVR